MLATIRRRMTAAVGFILGLVAFLGFFVVAIAVVCLAGLLLFAGFLFNAVFVRPARSFRKERRFSSGDVIDAQFEVLSNSRDSDNEDKSTGR